MPEHREHFDFDLPMPDALLVCREAVAELDWEVVGEDATGLVCKELPTALMQAGVPGVVGTLWPVNDFSTALLMVKFYELYLHGDIEAGGGPVPPVRALCRAQRWLKNLSLGEIEGMLALHPHLAEALRRALESDSAETALRGLRDDAKEQKALPFNKPYFWAPFVFVGA